MVLVARENTVFSMHDTCHQFALGIVISYSLTVDYALRRSRQIAPYGIKRIFNFTDFIESYGRSGIAFNTTSSLAFLVITTETLGQDVRRQQHITDLQNRENLFQLTNTN